ncbi:MAG: transporter, partial [Bacteroidetes bacterium 4572_77]
MTNLENRISDIIAQFPALNLEQVNKVGLMNRVDTKFYFSIHLLPKILESIKIDYSVLEINGSRMMPYESTYYDTKDFQMLRWHQNGKGNRYKIRERKYVLTEQTFFEVKFK